MYTKEQVQRPKDVSQYLQFAKSPLGSANMVSKERKKKKKKKKRNRKEDRMLIEGD